MIRVFHGGDGFSIEEAVARLRRGVGAEELRDANTAVFEGKSVPAGAVLATASAMPFLANRRLVLVKGVLSRLDENDKTLGDGWDGLAEKLEGLPSTTDLVFVDEKALRKGGRGLRAAGPAAEVREFQQPRGQALTAWIRERFELAGAEAHRDALTQLAWLSGGDLHLLEQEVWKLALYAAGRPVTRGDVDAMVPEARQESIFAATDAVMERRPGVAMRLLYGLLEQGSSSSDIIGMLARQVRLCLLARDLDGVPDDEVGRRIGVKSRFALEKTLRQARRFNHDYLATVHRRLLAADLSIKTGQMDERLAVEVLVARLAG